jgi:transcriptional regulator with XRE-family HTH domain
MKGPLMSTLIREYRERGGVSVRELARRLDVSPATVQNYERAEAAGRIQLDTLRRALAALDAQVSVRVTPLATRLLDRREERVALELHKKVAEHLLRDSDSTLANVSRVATEARRRVDPYTAGLLDEWMRLADERDLPGLLHAMTAPDQHSIDMRQVGPFNGVLSEDERLDAIRRAH